MRHCVTLFRDCDALHPLNILTCTLSFHSSKSCRIYSMKDSTRSLEFYYEQRTCLNEIQVKCEPLCVPT